jgi:hypothetical protein
MSIPISVVHSGTLHVIELPDIIVSFLFVFGRSSTVPSHGFGSFLDVVSRNTLDVLHLVIAGSLSLLDVK